MGFADYYGEFFYLWLEFFGRVRGNWIDFGVGWW